MKKFIRYLSLVLSLTFLLSLVPVKEAEAVTQTLGNATITANATMVSGSTVNKDSIQKWSISGTACGIGYTYHFTRKYGQSWEACMSLPGNNGRTNSQNLTDLHKWAVGQAQANGIKCRLTKGSFNSIFKQAFEEKRKEINSQQPSATTISTGELFYAEVPISSAQWLDSNKGSDKNKLFNHVINSLVANGGLQSKGLACNNPDAARLIQNATDAPDLNTLQSLKSSMGGAIKVFDPDGTGSKYIVPVYILAPTWVGNNGAHITYNDFIHESYGSWPKTTDPGAGKSQLQNWVLTKDPVSKTVDVSQVFNTRLQDGSYVSCKYVIGHEPEAATGDGTFTVVGSPKRQAVTGPWTSQETGLYKVFISPDSNMLRAELGVYNITVKATDAGGDVAGTLDVNTFGVVGASVTSESKQGNTYSFNVDKENLQKFNGTGNGSSGRAYIMVSFKVNGNGAEDDAEYKQKAKIEVSSVSEILGTKVWTATGTDSDPDSVGGVTHASWVPSELPPPPPPGADDLVHDVWELHTVARPSAAGTIVANQYSNQDWEATAAIPNTENVSAVLGAETSMIDLNGHVTATNKPAASAKGGVENDKGVDQGTSPAVTRNIVIKASVNNLWGHTNSLCTLFPAGDSNSGGIDTGRCPHSGSVSAFGPGAFQQMTVPACTRRLACSYHQWYTCGSPSTVISATGGEEAVEGPNGSVTMVPTGESDSRSPCHHDCRWWFGVTNGIIGVNANKHSGEMSTIYSFGVVWQNCNPSQYHLMGGSPATVVVGGAWNGIQYTSFMTNNTQCGDFTGAVTGSVYFAAVANQYYYITGSVACTRPNGTESVTFNPEVGSGDPLCSGYTHGFGSSVQHQENMVHQGSHTYTLTYVETVDNYAYRRIENAVVYALMKSELANIHQINFSGGEANGTSGAPLVDSANGQSVNAPEMFGCLWRGLGPKSGSYSNYSGRIIFEGWKDPSSPYVPLSLNGNHAFGDANLTFNITADHIYADACMATTNGGVSWVTSIAEKDTTDRGDKMQRNWGNHVSSTEDEWRDIKTGDCMKTSLVCCSDHVQSGNSNQFTEYKQKVAAMQRATVNEWQTRNKDEFYHANVVSDSFAYGNSQNVTVVRGDIYGVDEGIPLFNFQLGYEEGNTVMDGSKTVHRPHQSVDGGGQALLQKLKGDGFSVATITDGAPMPYMGYSPTGMNEFDGGNESFEGSLTGKLYTGNITGYGKGVRVSLTKGESVSNPVYQGSLGPTANYGAGNGSTLIKGVTSCGNSASTFRGYWDDHTYQGHHASTLTVTTANGSTQAISASNCGTHNLSTEGASFIINNIALNPNTPNGSWNTADAKFSYVEVMRVETGGGGGQALPEVEMPSHQAVASNGLYIPLSEMYIYNPISTEFAQTIGAEYGNWSGSANATPDESIYDSRVETANTPNNKLESFTTPSRRTSIWITPLGDMNKTEGVGIASSSKGSNSQTGEIYRGDAYNGYMADMNVEQWIGEWGIQYPYLIKFGGDKVTTDTSEIVNSERLDRVYGSFVSSPSALDDFKDDSLDVEFKYGDCFYSRTTPYMSEMKDGILKVYAKAKTAYVQTGSGTASYGWTEATPERNTRTSNQCYTEIEIDAVGSIGNIAIHDTSDFRFSNFFKKATDDWLIDGVVHTVDVEDPVRIVAAPKDILDRAIERSAKYSDNKPTHATLDVTRYRDDKGLAGPYENLPLVPAYNAVKEFKSEALRIGYKTLMSVETIGNYQALIVDGTKYPVSTAQETPENDNRTNYLEINSHYYLYDFDDGKFYAIDLWSGGTGKKTRIYNGKTDKVELSTNSEGLYINLDEEAARRNLGDTEFITTEASIVPVIQPTAITSGEEYIGYTGHLKLDNRDLTYIGSDFMMNDSFSEFSDSMNLIGPKAQRWHFTQGLTSTTSASYHVDSTDQAVIEAASIKLKEEHPHAVIIEFNDYIAHGELWSIRYEGSLYNNPVIKFYSDVANERPDWITASSKTSTTYQGAEVYDRGGTTALYTIDKDITPVIVYDAYKTAADDRTVSGTH